MRRPVLIDVVRRALGAGPSSGRRCLCPHAVAEHDDIRGCTHLAGAPCLCPAGPETVTDERREYKR